MSHSPEPRPCVSAAGEREPARGLGRVSVLSVCLSGCVWGLFLPALQPCPGRGRGAERGPRTPPAPHTARHPSGFSTLVPPPPPPPPRPRGTAAERWARCVCVCARVPSPPARPFLRSPTAAAGGGEGLTAPEGEGRPRRALLPAGRTPTAAPSIPSRRSHLPSSAPSPFPTGRAGARPRPGGPHTPLRRAEQPRMRGIRAAARSPPGVVGRGGAGREDTRREGASRPRWQALSPQTQNRGQEAARRAAEIASAPAWQEAAAVPSATLTVMVGKAPATGKRTCSAW